MIGRLLYQCHSMIIPCFSVPPQSPNEQVAEEYRLLGLLAWGFEDVQTGDRSGERSLV